MKNAGNCSDTHPKGVPHHSPGCNPGIGKRKTQQPRTPLGCRRMGWGSNSQCCTLGDDVGRRWRPGNDKPKDDDGFMTTRIVTNAETFQCKQCHFMKKGYHSSIGGSVSGGKNSAFCILHSAFCISLRRRLYPHRTGGNHRDYGDHYGGHGRLSCKCRPNVDALAGATTG